jgi:hypothetical protein
MENAEEAYSILFMASLRVFSVKGRVLSVDLQDRALEILGLFGRQQHGVVAGLGAHLQEPRLPAC